MKSFLRLCLDTARRFPAAVFLSLLNFVPEADLLWHFLPARANRCLAASFVGIYLSVLFGLLCERFSGKRGKWLRFSSQLLVLPLVFALTALFAEYGKIEDHFRLSYALTILSLASLVAITLTYRKPKEEVFPSLAFAAILAGVVTIGISGGLSLILFAVEELFALRVSSCFYSYIWNTGSTIVGFIVLLACWTRREAFAYPKIWRVLQGFVSMPILLALTAVLWTYLLSRVICWNLPNGEIYYLVAIASVLWFLQHLMLGAIDSRPAKLFRRFGALFILPLLALQSLALAIRINEYGLTPSRYSCILLTLFFAIVALVALLRRGAIERTACLIFALFALFAALSPWNPIDVGASSQMEILKNFVARREAGENFTEKERMRIMDLVDFAVRYELVGSSYRSTGLYRYCEKSSVFEKEWGFKYIPSYERRVNDLKKLVRYHSISFTSFGTIDLSSFAEARFVKLSSDYADGNVTVTLESGEEKLDITSLLTPLIDDNAPRTDVFIDLGDGRKLLLFDVSVRLRIEAKHTELSSVHGRAMLFYGRDHRR